MRRVEQNAANRVQTEKSQSYRRGKGGPGRHIQSEEAVQ